MELPAIRGTGTLVIRGLYKNQSIFLGDWFRRKYRGGPYTDGISEKSVNKILDACRGIYFDKCIVFCNAGS